ncbi:mechanosensitive ion channel family protein [Ectothiorhodospira lacustris]|uniref:mechanosensitive ion channel family protein n=1 Tax=Ectothiorhodospira lacustris TaxID=2899127 RepID=UPI001EE94219|nr:mechanosensitive ion channel family protein [Ectothiorhodospira lacustris]MCG5511444.1 mechanosensitive ion channel [Ectothiorhodospira lacustris]MCG5523230.1 mechanosensitive ion channel [Ectothiorhodospira lacustris]
MSLTQIKDTHGYPVGDQVLIRMGQTLADSRLEGLNKFIHGFTGDEKPFTASNPRTHEQALMDDTYARKIPDPIEEKSNGGALKKHPGPARNGRRPRSRMGQPAQASAIHGAGTPGHQGRSLVRTWGFSRARVAGLICAMSLCCAVFAINSVAAQQAYGSEDRPVRSSAPDGTPEPPGRVEVQRVAKDDQIRQRITDILRATNWFSEPEVTVQEGIVFLKGTTANEESKQWARDLAKNTEGVVAVVNEIEVVPTTVWDFDPAFQVLNDLARGLVRSLPLIVVAVGVIVISWILARLTVFVLRRRLLARPLSQLLREVLARAAGMLVMLAGLYLVLRIAGLTQLALTVVGGTGLIGLVLGIAFRDITENFLASLFLSLQQPFREGDLVEVANVTGYVQRLTSRTTVLMTLDGNQVQVPNSTVFKSTLRNFTSNPNRRDDFIVGIGYENSISSAQEVALKVLGEHPAVLHEPEPMVLVEELGPSTVNLRVYFWIDGGRHSWVKVKSSVIRLVKRAFQDAGISLAGEVRDITSAEGMPVGMMESEGHPEPVDSVLVRSTVEPKTVATSAEAGLQSEAQEIKEQARRSWTPGENLLTSSSSADTH